MKIPTLLPWLFLAVVLHGSITIGAQSGVGAVLPNGREIHPLGSWIPLAPYPFALAVRADGGQLAVPSIGFPFALNVIDRPADGHPTEVRMPDGDKNDPNVEVHAGLAYSPDGATLYVATGDSGKVRTYSTTDWKVTGEVSLDGECDGRSYAGSFAATLVVSADGETIYALDQGNWRVVILDARGCGWCRPSQLEPTLSDWRSRPKASAFISPTPACLNIKPSLARIHKTLSQQACTFLPSDTPRHRHAKEQEPKGSALRDWAMRTPIAAVHFGLMTSAIPRNLR